MITDLTKYSACSILPNRTKRNYDSKMKIIEDQKPAILYVDDEEKCLKYFKRTFQKKFRIFTASNVRDGYKLFKEKQDEIGVLITDQQMPRETGVQLLEKSLRLKPNVIRLLVTAYSDTDAIIDAINLGSVHKYITKPWDLDKLSQLLEQSVALFLRQREQDKLVHEKFSIVRNQLRAERVVMLGSLAANLSHHINNALVAVRVFLDLAPDKLEKEKKEATNIADKKYWVNLYQKAKSQVLRITELLTDLESAPQKPGYPFRDTIKINELLLQTLSFLQPRLTEKKIGVTCEIPENLPPLVVDQTKFQRLFLLLLQDEVAHLAKGESIFIQAHLVSEGQNLDPKIRINIKSNGYPLSEEMIRSLLDPSFIRDGNPQELRINLMACYIITYYHSGTLKISREEVSGETTFSLTFPLKPKLRTSNEEELNFVAKTLTDPVKAHS